MRRTETKRSGGFFKGMLDGLRSTVGQPAKSDAGVEENLRPEHFQIVKTVRHGFPFEPTAIAFDPIQRLLAIGTKNGSLRIFGRPGVDCSVQHVLDIAVLQIIFLINDGAIITVCADDTLHLWNLRQKKPEIVHTLKFQKERVTFCCLSIQSKWLYIGTERGNVHIVNVESFILSGYIINWNKTVELARKNHPGCIVHLSDNPLDLNKLLIGFESGAIVMWDLRNKAVEFRFQNSEILKSISWHHEGKQFMCSHSDGSISTWNIKITNKPQSVTNYHAKVTKDGNTEPCKEIPKVEWKTVKGGDSFIIFSGGLPVEKANQTPCLTVVHGKITTVLEMEHNIIDFVTLCENPFPSDYHEPYAVVVLLYNDLVIVDLKATGYPCFQNPYPMDLHESPVTYCTYLADCPPDLISAFYSVGNKGNRRSGFSEKDWPIDGGEWGTATVSYPEIIITGHADGSLKFWDASRVSLHILYKLKTSKVFERPKAKSVDGQDDDPFAIDQVAFCPESRILCVAGASSQVLLFRFNKQESLSEVFVLHIPILYEVDDDPELSPDCEYPSHSSYKNVQQGLPTSASEDSTKKSSSEYCFPLKLKPGPLKKHPGFQVDLVCLTPRINGEALTHITALNVNSVYGLMAYGNECGLAIVDIVQKCCLLNFGTPDLYGSADPYQRVPRSPKRNATTTTDNPSNNDPDRCRSPVSEQVCQNINGICLSPTTGKQQQIQPKKTIVPEMRRTKSQDKIDSSFSRSRSSSMSSLENISSEAIQCLIFADSYSRKSDTTTSPTLWVGTNLGSILGILLTLPPNDTRQTQPVIVTPSGTIFRLKGSILTISFLDCTGALIPGTFELWKDSQKDSERIKVPSNVQKGKVSPTSSSSDMRDTQYAVMASEKHARVVAMPSQTCIYKINLTETSFVVRAEVLSLKGSDSVCLASYVATGNIVIYSLPSLKSLYEADFLPLVDMRIARTFGFSKNGHGMYLSSPTELQKFTISSAYCENLQDMLGTLFLTKEMPEAPKQSFLKGLFGGGPSLLDREELFGESSGKASKTVARHIPGRAHFDNISTQTGTLASELARARQGLTERGEALSQLEERTAKMLSESESFSTAAHQLMNKYKDRKWYQF